MLCPLNTCRTIRWYQMSYSGPQSVPMYLKHGSLTGGTPPLYISAGVYDCLCVVCVYVSAFFFTDLHKSIIWQWRERKRDQFRYNFWKYSYLYMIHTHEIWPLQMYSNCWKSPPIFLVLSANPHIVQFKGPIVIGPYMWLGRIRFSVDENRMWSSTYTTCSLLRIYYFLLTYLYNTDSIAFITKKMNNIRMETWVVVCVVWDINDAIW